MGKQDGSRGKEKTSLGRLFNNINSSKVVNYDDVEVGHMIVACDPKCEDHYHIFTVVEKSKKHMELTVDLVDCTVPHKNCKLGNHKMGFDYLRNMVKRGLAKWVTSEMALILYGDENEQFKKTT